MYIPSFLDQLAAQQHDALENKTRLTITQDGGYIYKPTPAYFRHVRRALTKV